MPRWRFQFSLATLVQVMVLVSVLVAVFGSLLRESGNVDPASFLIFLALLLAAPIALTIVISLARPVFQGLSRLWNRRR